VRVAGNRLYQRLADAVTQPTATNVRDLRLTLNMTQVEFAALAGLKHYQNLSAIERGARRMSAVRWELLLTKLKKTAPRGAVKGANHPP
jgi:DNA-binding transcriptional regulator YiaG